MQTDILYYIIAERDSGTNEARNFHNSGQNQREICDIHGSFSVFMAEDAAI